MKDIEIEIKVRVSNGAQLQDFLEKEATFTGEEYQKDEYFTPAHRNFVGIRPVAEWLRLRQSDQNAITYKNFHFGKDGKSAYCDEYESSIGDIDQLQKIFKALNIEPVITLEKTRKTWKYQDYEIALDRVTGLGDFVEVEYKAHTEDDPQVITEAMIGLLKQIGCGKIERSFLGYPFMLLYPEEITFELV